MTIDFKSVLNGLIILVHLLTDWLLELILGWYWGERKRCTAPSSAEQEKIVTKGALELASLIREKKLKSYDVVKAYCERIGAVNPELNAVVDGPFLDALEQASAIDKQLEANAFDEQYFVNKPFLGVPFTTKDSTAVGGKLHTLGLISRKTTRAKEDAECVRLMKEAGAIIIATSNVPEVNKWMESRNLLTGQTCNPYDLRRSVGGSSGGEGALLSACCTGFGLGTDIGGSIRIPAFSCGVFGHKPTKNLVNTRGCTFRKGDEQQTMVVAGPMSRTATDLKAIFKVLVGAKQAEQLRLNQQIDLKKLRYFYIPSNNYAACNPINSETQAIMNKIQSHFAQLTGVDVKLATLPHLNKSNRMWRYWMTQEPANFNKLLGNGATLNPIVELVKKLLGQSEYTMASIYSLVDGLLPPERKELIEAATAELKTALKQLLGNDGVLFYHSAPRSAPFHYYPLFKFTDFSYFSVFNVLHVPVTQVPMGLDSKGMPLGIQVVAAENMDALCLAVAEELERGFGGWVPPYGGRQ